MADRLRGWAWRLGLGLGLGALVGHGLACLAQAGYPRAAWGALLTLVYLALLYGLGAWWWWRGRR